MKFSEMPYSRPDIDALKARAAHVVEALTKAESAREQADIYLAFEEDFKGVETMGTLAYIRHTINTKDEFYAAEQDWLDEVMPQVEELSQSVSLALLGSPFRGELEGLLGKLLFDNMEIAVRCFKPELMPLMAEENRLSSEYQKLYASAVVEFDGRTMPLPMLGPYKQSTDRAVRKAAYEIEGRFFDEHREALDELYDKLVKNRTEQARMLGYKNYLPLGYDRMGRNCYGPEKVAAFRRQVVSQLVPLVQKLKEDQRRRLGLEKMYFYDDVMLFPDGNATPQGTAEDILKAGLDMYHGLSAETAEFIDFMYDNELLDVLSKDGKAPGGYCTSIPQYQAPFIFSNFNGTAADVDVLTHEAGHAFADYRAQRKGYIRSLQSPTMDGCECHSMTMEFLTEEFHKNFFGNAVDKYEIGHCEDALFFLPYGCLVDEFQHRVYEQPEMTPAERNALWASLEKKFRPWLDFAELPFYGRGAGWQRQLHIYQMPFYYIDYCMAQTVAFQFWLAAMNDPADAWQRYLTFVDKGGTATFEELVRSAGLLLPYDEGCLEQICRRIGSWVEEHK